MFESIKNKYEFVYTNAVIMHLNTERAISFLKNIISMNPKYISIVEGTPNHDWTQLYRTTNMLDIYNKIDSNHQDFRNFILK